MDLLICQIEGLFLGLRLFMINESLSTYRKLLLSISLQIDSTVNIIKLFIQYIIL